MKIQGNKLSTITISFKISYPVLRLNFVFHWHDIPPTLLASRFTHTLSCFPVILRVFQTCLSSRNLQRLIYLQNSARQCRLLNPWLLDAFERDEDHIYCSGSFLSSAEAKFTSGTGRCSRRHYPNRTKIRISEPVLLPTVLVSPFLSPVTLGPPQALSTHPNASIPVSYLSFIFSWRPLHQHPPISRNPTSCLMSSSIFLALITSRWMRKLGKEPVKLKLNDVFGSQDACRSGFIVDV